jgi:hypothetical protein
VDQSRNLGCASGAEEFVENGQRFFGSMIEALDEKVCPGAFRVLVSNPRHFVAVHEIS